MDQPTSGTGPVEGAQQIRSSSARETVSAHVSLFTSLATLFCCALPALVVLIGFSLTGVLTFFTSIPGWQSFCQYDIWLFRSCGILLALGFYFAYFRPKRLQGVGL